MTHFRVMVHYYSQVQHLQNTLTPPILQIKYYPWTKLTIFIYKFMRLFTVLATTSFQVLSKQLKISALDSTLLAIYLGVFISFNTGLLARIPSWTQHKRGLAKKVQDLEKAIGKPVDGVQSLLSDVQTLTPAEEKILGRSTLLGSSTDPETEEQMRVIQSGSV